MAKQTEIPSALHWNGEEPHRNLTGLIARVQTTIWSAPKTRTACKLQDVRRNTGEHTAHCRIRLVTSMTVRMHLAKPLQRGGLQKMRHIYHAEESPCFRRINPSRKMNGRHTHSFFRTQVRSTTRSFGYTMEESHRKNRLQCWTQILTAGASKRWERDSLRCARSWALMRSDKLLAQTVRLYGSRNTANDDAGGDPAQWNRRYIHHRFFVCLLWMYDRLILPVARPGTRYQWRICDGREAPMRHGTAWSVDRHCSGLTRRARTGSE